MSNKPGVETDESMITDSDSKPSSADGEDVVGMRSAESFVGSSGYSLKDIQTVNTLILEEIDRVCRLHGLRYFLSEGTLLGAIRHGSSIPWDDDADISMPRKDYEKFLEVAPSEFTKCFELSTPDDYGDHAFFDFIPHVNYLDSRVTDPDGKMAFYGGKLNHIHVDIFVLDGAAEGFSQAWRRIRLKFVYALSWAHRFEIDYSNYSSVQRPIVWLLSHLGRCRRQSKLNAAYTRIAKSAPSSVEAYYLSNTLEDELDRAYPKTWFSEVDTVDYDGHHFYAPRHYESVLEELYGDWRKLPSLESQVPEHYDLDDPYLYIGR